MLNIKGTAHTGLRNRKRIALLVSTIFATGAALPAMAQLDAPPVFKEIDKNGVELRTGKLVLVLASVGIGSGSGSVSYNWSTSQAAQTDAIGYIIEDNSVAANKTFSVVIGGSTETFNLSGTLGVASFTQKEGRGSTLVYNSGTGVYTYTGSSGTIATFGRITTGSMTSSYPSLLTLTYPAGETLTYSYRDNGAGSYGLKSVASSLGYQLRVSGTFVGSGQQYYISDVVAFNMADETCDPAANSCTLTGTWPSLSINSTNTVATDATGKWVSINGNSSGQAIIAYSSGKTITYSTSGGRISSVTDGRGTWTYTYPTPVGVATIVKAPGETTGTAYQFNTGRGQLINMTPEGGVAASYSYDSSDRLASTGHAAGRVTQYSYDSRGNVTETRTISRTPGTPADIVTSAAYPSSCSNQKTCNQPTYTIDANGQQTDYTYDSTHGGVLTATLPAAPSGVRPQVRYSYTAMQANFRNGSGTLIQGAPAYRLTATSQCRTMATCAGGADEVKSTIGYGVDDDLLPTSVSTGAGDGSLTATTQMTYTTTGQVSVVDGPVSGSDDAVRTYYDAMGRVIGVIGGDPDGSGSLPRQATRTTYNADGDVASVETGTATSQSDSGMSTFSALREVAIDYDAQGRPVKSRLVAGGTTYAVDQTSYTDAGRTECVATRMNAATFSSLPSSACTLATTGTLGPDRITRTVYDSGGRVSKIQSGYGTGVQVDEVAYGYTAGGQIGTLTDANGNRTTYNYDGHDRLAKTAFPSPTTPGASSTTDYQELGYDPAGNITSRRIRDGRSFTYSYDNLGRLSVKVVPDNCVSGYVCAALPASAVRDVYYGYDLLGHPLYARFDSHSGADAVVNAYDALGRVTSSTTSMGGVSRALSYGYGTDGARTMLVHPDGNYVNYIRDATGRTYYTLLNGGTPLYYPSYDTAGRPYSMYRWAGGTWNIPSYYGYDAVSRLTSIADYFTSSGYNSSLSFTYNPAGQIAAKTQGNTAYAFGGYASATRGYTVNGLNQYGSAGSVSFGYDSNGNLNVSGSTAYSYDAENRLVAASGGVTLGYDPLGRLYETYSPSTGTTRFLYDGQDLVAEYNGSGTLLRRYVHGDGDDAPLVWYEGSGVSSPRYLFSDHLGSVTAVADASGNVMAVNSYDEHGIPASGNAGRFQYTGQAWIPELGMYHYKARLYSPTLGRFMQSDPIGYGDGPNMYAYVGNDPINRRDPSGLCSAPYYDQPDCQIVVRAWGSWGQGSYSQSEMAGGVALRSGTPGAPAKIEIHYLSQAFQLRQRVTQSVQPSRATDWRRCLFDLGLAGVKNNFTWDALGGHIFGAGGGAAYAYQANKARWAAAGYEALNSGVAVTRAIFSKATLWGLAASVAWNTVSGGIKGYKESAACKRLFS